MSFVKQILLQCIAWLTRPLTHGALLLRTGSGLLIASIAGGFVVSVALPDSLHNVELIIDTAGAPEYAVFVGVASGLVLLILGAALTLIEHWRQRRQQVIVVEQRGLRDFSDSPLAAALPNTLRGHRDTLVNDLRRAMKDGVVVSPEGALDEIAHLPRDISHRLRSRDVNDVTIVYGGLVPIPFGFLTGQMLDSQHTLILFDWDRDQNLWRPLNGEDDGDRFVVEGLDGLSAGTKEVVVATSVSYGVDEAGIAETFPNIPVVHLRLLNGNQSCHWSEAKQQDLARQLREVMTEVSNRGIDRIHMIVAAPNSLTVRFGRVCDRRNLPETVVYQYERSRSPRYPWGIRMPQHSGEAARVVVRKAALQADMT